MEIGEIVEQQCAKTPSPLHQAALLFDDSHPNCVVGDIPEYDYPFTLVRQ